MIIDKMLVAGIIIYSKSLIVYVNPFCLLAVRCIAPTECNVYTLSIFLILHIFC